MKYTFYINIVFAFAISFLFQSCGTTDTHDECINKYNRLLEIRWGYYYARDNSIVAYTISSEAKIYTYNKAGGQKNFSIEPIGSVGRGEYCSTINMIRDTMLATQALMVPGDTSQFIEYYNPGYVNDRAIWNSKFDNYGSKGYRELFDSLEALRSRARPGN